MEEVTSVVATWPFISSSRLLVMITTGQLCQKTPQTEGPSFTEKLLFLSPAENAAGRLKKHPPCAIVTPSFKFTRYNAAAPFKRIEILTMRKIIPAVAFLFLVVGVLHTSGCSKRVPTTPPSAQETGTQDRVMAVSEMLEEARAEGAEDTWEYEEAQKLFEMAQDLISEGELEEAEKVLSQAELKATQAIGAAREGAFMEGFDEEAQEIRKSLLSDAFSKENLINLPTSDVFFEFDSAEISKEAMEAIDGNISIFEKNKDKIKFILVFGFCDVRGTEEYNLSLGKKRADEIKKYMIGKGMSPDSLHSISKGETEIWQEGTSDEAYSRNRRAHFMALSDNNSSEN